MRSLWQQWKMLVEQPGFVIGWTSQLTSSLGGSLYKIAIVVYIYNLTGSPFRVGLIMATTALPAVVFGSLIGVLVDRYPYRTLKCLADIAGATAVLCMIFTTNTALLLTLTFIIATCNRIRYTAYLAMLAVICPHDRLHNANALTSLTRRALTLTGPSISGIAIAISGTQTVFVLTAICFLASAAIVSLLTQQIGQPRQRTLASSVGQEWKEGLIRLRTDPVLMQLVALSAVLALPTGVNNALLVVFVSEVLALPPEYLGYYSSALVAGFMVGAVVVNSVPGTQQYRIKVALLSALCGGLMFVAFGLTRSMYLAMMWRVAIGICFAVFNISVMTVLQQRVEAGMRGRVLSLYTTVDEGLALACLGLAGAVAEFISSGQAFVISGLMVLLFLGVSSLRSLVRKGRDFSSVDQV